MMEKKKFKNFIDWHTYPKTHLRVTGFGRLESGLFKKKKTKWRPLAARQTEERQEFTGKTNRKNRKVDVEDGTSKREGGQQHAPKVTHMHLAAKAVQSKLSGSSIHILCGVLSGTAWQADWKVCGTSSPVRLTARCVS